MAKRLRPRHQEEVKAKIQVSVILQRLHAGLMGEVDLTPVQVAAAKILLDKALSNAPQESLIDAMVTSQSANAEGESETDHFVRGILAKRIADEQPEQVH